MRSHIKAYRADLHIHTAARQKFLQTRFEASRKGIAVMGDPQAHRQAVSDDRDPEGVCGFCLWILRAPKSLAVRLRIRIVEAFDLISIEASRRRNISQFGIRGETVTSALQKDKLWRETEIANRSFSKTQGNGEPHGEEQH